MRIESIEIKNFRQYRNVKFVFPSVNGKKDVHIVVGEGGEGKTNILNALTWCLYEEEMHLGNAKEAIAMINSQYVAELRAHNERNGEVTVTVEISSDDRHKWTLTRTAVYSITAEDLLKIDTQCLIIDGSQRSGHQIIDNPDDINAYIQRYVPREINDYIFFDGEHLDDYFKDEKKQNIENGIKDLTQASIVKKSIDALDKYVKNEINPLLKNSGDTAVSEAQTRVEKLSEILEQSEITINELKSQIDTLDKRIDNYQTIIRGHENLKEKAVRMEELERESDELAKKDKEAMANLMKFVREYYTYFALYPAMKEFANYIDTQTKAGNLPPKIDKKLVAAMLTQKKCLICDQPLDEKHLAGIETLLRRLEVSSATSAELNRASSALQAYFDKIADYQKLKTAFITARLNLQEQINANEQEYQGLSEYMHNIPNSEEIADAINNVEACKEQKNKLTLKLAKETIHKENTERDLEDAQKALDKAMSKNKLMEVFRRQKDFCTSSIQILTETMDEILKECREDMQTSTFKIFTNLMWKKDIFTRIEILEDYSFKLLDYYGNQTLGSCSAAERALLALSFTLALQETSGHDSLLYIDTPLGRVGEKSRATFADVLLDISDNKQVILTFTPTEYDPKVRAKLSGVCSSYCELNFENGITTVKK